MDFDRNVLSTNTQHIHYTARDQSSVEEMANSKTS